MMNEALIVEVPVAVESDALIPAEALVELSAHDLALVGGGAANVCFL